MPNSNFFLKDDLTVGEIYALSRDHKSKDLSLLSGWGNLESSGTWTIAPKVTAHLSMRDERTTRTKFSILATPYLHAKRSSRSLELKINEFKAGKFTLSATSKLVTIDLAKGVLSPTTEVELAVESPESPARYQGTKDERTLGFYVHKIIIA